MKIVQDVAKHYGELSTGETFMASGELYMVTDNVSKNTMPVVYESVSLEDGSTAVFGEKTFVTPVTCEVRVVNG